MNTSQLLEQSTQWLSRAIAVVLIMLAPGALGAFADGRLGTSLFTPLGFMLGVLIGVASLLVIVKHLNKDQPAHTSENQDFSPPDSHTDESQSS